MPASRKSKTVQVTASAPRPAPTASTATESLRALQLSLDTRQ